MNALALGLCYFVIVFAGGFAMGIVRTLWIAPAIGSLPAVLIELPFMIGLSWLVCHRLTARRSLSPAARALMGGSAFVWLMLVELGLSLAFGRSASQHFAALVTSAGLAGLAGQLVFAAMPMLQRPRQP